jgi:ABC-type antimicrobial peptide transport system permease subunit
MIAHISFTEMVSTAFVIFMAGVIAGIYMAYKLDGLTLWGRKKK